MRRLPLVLARAGLNPQNIALDETGDVLAVAAGESGEVLLMSARSLTLLRRLSMPGMVFDVTLCGGTVHALCLNDALDSDAGNGSARSARGRFFRFRACRGGLPADGETAGLRDRGVFARGFCETACGFCIRSTRPGTGGRLPAATRALCFLFDGLSERIFARSSGGCWNLFCGCARDMQRLSGKG